MKADVTISNIYWNKGLANFFFREQAYKTLEEFISRSSLDGQHTLNALDELTDGMDIDDVEGLFYEMSVDEVANEIGFYDLEELDNEED